MQRLKTDIKCKTYKNIYLLYNSKVPSIIVECGFISNPHEAELLTTENYKDSVLKAVNLGEDTDTIAAITGSMSGLYYGYDSISYEWVQVLLNKELIDEIINKH